ncbi:glycosyltransferase [Gorillibacterium massiliense]|uniref:glycosyltransferase n=1 Tax=Gorillibacterium massiliense TaxID=1280390 RepID=UPI0004B4FAF4|nr:glycosyltransferase [Gorillibacterium massiliense]
MKVGIVMPLAEQRGGAELMLLHLLKANREAEKVEYSLAFLEHGPLVQQAQDLGYSVAVYPAGRLRSLWSFAKTAVALFRWMKREKLQLVMSWMGKAHLYASVGAVAAGIPAVWWQHGLAKKGWSDWLISRLPAKLILSCSETAAAAQRKVSPRMTIRVVYPAVELQRFDPGKLPNRQEARRRLDLPENAKIVGTVGRLQRWKGMHQLIEAAGLAVRECPDLYVVIVGGEHFSEPDYPEELRQLARRADIADKVLFAGQQQDVPLWMQAFDVFVHCSTGTEPFGMVVIEAMALGKAVVASQKGGPMEIIEPGESGLLVDMNNASALSESIAAILKSPELEEKLSKQGILRAGYFHTGRLSAETAAILSGTIHQTYTEPMEGRIQM